eukprot:141035-Chlamydomonas_euryale.AAC.8
MAAGSAAIVPRSSPGADMCTRRASCEGWRRTPVRTALDGASSGRVGMPAAASCVRPPILPSASHGESSSSCSCCACWLSHSSAYSATCGHTAARGGPEPPPLRCNAPLVSAVATARSPPPPALAPLSHTAIMVRLSDWLSHSFRRAS